LIGNGRFSAHTGMIAPAPRKAGLGTRQEIPGWIALALMRPGKSKAFLSFILLFCIALGGANSGMLCHGFDGHSEIEFGRVLPCGFVKAGAFVQFQELRNSLCSSSTADGCNPCLDIPLSISGDFSYPTSFQSRPDCRRLLAVYPTPRLYHSDPGVVIGRTFSPRQSNQPPFALTLLSAVIILV